MHTHNKKAKTGNPSACQLNKNKLGQLEEVLVKTDSNGT